MNRQEAQTEECGSDISDLEARNAEEVKGGPTPKSKRDLILKTSVEESDDSAATIDDTFLNHNETTLQAEAEVASVTGDLEARDANDIKGGPSTQIKRDVILKSSVIVGED